MSSPYGKSLWSGIAGRSPVKENNIRLDRTAAPVRDPHSSSPQQRMLTKHIVSSLICTVAPLRRRERLCWHQTREPQAPGVPNDGGGRQTAPIRRTADAKPARRQIAAGRPVAPAGKKPQRAPKRPGPKQIIPLEEGGFKDF